jgi:hypothetical protein
MDGYQLLGALELNIGSDDALYEMVRRIRVVVTGEKFHSVNAGNCRILTTIPWCLLILLA